MFCRHPGFPLDNNLCEQAQKLVAQHRKNAEYFRTQRGAEAADVIMSLGATAKRAGANAHHYFVILQRYKDKVEASPDASSLGTTRRRWRPSRRNHHVAWCLRFQKPNSRTVTNGSSRRKPGATPKSKVQATDPRVELLPMSSTSSRPPARIQNIGIISDASGGRPASRDRAALRSLGKARTDYSAPTRARRPSGRQVLPICGDQPRRSHRAPVRRPVRRRRRPSAPVQPRGQHYTRVGAAAPVHRSRNLTICAQ